MSTCLFAPPIVLFQRDEARPAGRVTNPLLGLFRENSRRILSTYGLFQLENLLALAQPYALGVAINGLLASSPNAVSLFVLQHLTHLLVGSLRRWYDTRTYSAVYTRLATEMAVAQRSAGVEVSQVAARAVLSRELVYFGV